MQVIARIHTGPKADAKIVGEILRPFLTTDLAERCGTTCKAVRLETIQLASLENGAQVHVEIHLYSSWLHPEERPLTDLVNQLYEWLMPKLLMYLKVATVSLLIEEYPPTLIVRVK